MPRARSLPRSGRCSAFAGGTSATGAGAGTRCHRDACPRVLDALRANGPMTGDRARGRAARRRVVGLVGRQDRGRVAARRRRGGLHRASRLEAGLRPARARPGAAGAGRRPRRRGPACGWLGGPSRGGAGRGDDRRSGRLPPAQARSGPGGARRDRPRAGDGRRLARRRVGRSRARWRRSQPAGATAPRCCRPSTRSCGTALARCASSSSSTVWRPTSRRPSACTATSPCRCWPAGACAAASIPVARGSTLVAKRLSCEPGAVDAMAEALREAAEWVGCERRRARGGRSARAGRVAARGAQPASVGFVARR